MEDLDHREYEKVVVVYTTVKSSLRQTDVSQNTNQS